MTELYDRADCHPKGDTPEGLNLFFDSYLSDKEVAEDIDELCFGCPVRKQCLTMGVTTGGTGVHGGAYLMIGKWSKTKNSHKLPYVANKLQKEIAEIRAAKQ
jgi:hypothetical protein